MQGGRRRKKMMTTMAMGRGRREEDMGDRMAGQGRASLIAERWLCMVASSKCRRC